MSGNLHVMEEHSTLPFVPQVRRLAPEDLGFVFSTWLKHLKQHSHLTRNISNTVFFPHYHKTIEKLLARSIVVVAHQPDEPNTILGYAVLEPPTIHWVYVKGPWRRFGIAKLMLSGIDLPNCSFTHWTNDIEPLREKYPLAVYNPYLV